MEIFDAVGVQSLEELEPGEWRVYCKNCRFESGKNIMDSPYTTCPNCFKPLYFMQGGLYEGELKPISRSIHGKYRIGSGKAIYESYETAERAYDARAKKKK